jgi:hypothetical protein
MSRKTRIVSRELEVRGQTAEGRGRAENPTLYIVQYI